MWKKSLFFASFILLSANLIFLDIKYFSSMEPNAAETLSPLAPTSLIITPSISTSCPEVCLETISQATRSIALSSPTWPADRISQPTTQSSPSQPVTQPLVREFFIPFGTGSTTSRDWQDIQGTDTTINTANYGKIKKALFETNLYIPTGNGRAYAQLFDVTAKHPVWFSEVSTESKDPILLRTGPISLEKGEHTYRVQLKSSMGVKIVMDFARIKIVVK